MRYDEFKKKYLNIPFIIERDIPGGKGARQALRNQLNRWQKRGLVLKLKRGIYILNEDDRKRNPGRFVIANQLYAPSYVSLESALAFYGLIPERPADVTSVTTKKTQAISNAHGVFLYQHVKPPAFRGLRREKDASGIDYFIAEPEKAVVDFLYLNLDRISVEAKDIFSSSFRFQNLSGLKRTRIRALAHVFGSNKLLKVAGNLIEYMKKEKRS